MTDVSTQSAIVDCGLLPGVLACSEWRLSDIQVSFSDPPSCSHEAMSAGQGSNSISSPFIGLVAAAPNPAIASLPLS